MLKIRRHTLALLTVAALASFVTAQAQNAAASGLIRENKAWTQTGGVFSTTATGIDNALATRAAYADSVTTLEYRAPKGARATLYVQGRYGFELPGTGDWQTFSLRFRAPRFDEGFNKQQSALGIEARTGSSVQRNMIFEKPTPGARWENEDFRGPAFVAVAQGPFEVRNFKQDPADFSQLTPPKASGGDTNEKDLRDLVALGKDTFDSVGCSACHLVEPSSTAVSSGPNLYGLFRSDPRTREVVEGGEGHRFQVKVNREYLHHSVRAPADQLAVAESGATRGTAYPAVMPPFAKEVISDEQIDAIGAYLATLNDPGDRGPVTTINAFAPCCRAAMAL